MQTPDEMIAAIEAFKRDGKLQCKKYGTCYWGITVEPQWKFLEYKYRPVPKPKEIWVNVYEHGFRGYYHESLADALENKGSQYLRTVRYIEADPQLEV